MFFRAVSFYLALSFLAWSAKGEPQATPYSKDPGSFAVETLKLDWKDAKRDRLVPVKLYFPKTGPGPFPVIIFSHGLGGSRDGYEYLGWHWASHGYVSVHVQHLGSDTAVWLNRRPGDSVGAALNLENATNRPLDIRFAIDQVTKLNKEESVLRGRLDLEHIGVAGHSFGAYTTLAVAGQVFGPTETSFRDDRVKAAIAMSAPVPRKTNIMKSYKRIRIPILHMTGTEDNSPIGETSAAERRIPFDHIQGAEQYLVTFTGGDHMVFSGRFLASRGRNDALFQGLIKMSSTAFWDAWLKRDAKAKAWLDGFEKVLGPNGRFEKKGN